MRHALTLAALTLAALPAAAAPVARQLNTPRPPAAAVCRGDALPFAVVVSEFTDGTDSEVEAVAAALWAELCNHENQARDPYARTVCGCVPPSRRY